MPKTENLAIALKMIAALYREGLINTTTYRKIVKKYT